MASSLRPRRDTSHAPACWEEHRRSGIDSDHGPPAASEYATQIAQCRKYLIVPVRALSIIGALLVFDDVLILAEDVFGEPHHERPHRVDDSGHARLLHGQIAVGTVGALLRIQGRIAEPDIEDRILGFLNVAAHPHLKSLRGIVSTDAHVVGEALLHLAALAHQIHDHLLADGRSARGPAEAIFHLRPGLAMLPPDAMGLDGAHVFAVHELMVHVEEVLVHKAVVAGDLTAPSSGLVVAWLRKAG